jgi:hypothetical protein
MDMFFFLLWPVGFALGVWEAFRSTKEDFKADTCGFVKQHSPWNVVEATVIILCFAMSLLAHTLSMSRVWRSPDSVQRTVWRMARMYTGSFLLSYGPLVVFLVSSDSVSTTCARILAEVALCFKSLNGFLNTTVCYVLSSRYRLKLEPHQGKGQDSGVHAPRQEMGGVISFHVDFRSIQRIDVNSFAVSSERIDNSILAPQVAMGGA